MLASPCTIPVSAGGKFLDTNYFCNALYCAIPFHSVQSNEITETGKGILNQTIEEQKQFTKLDPKKCRV